MNEKNYCSGNNLHQLVTRALITIFPLIFILLSSGIARGAYKMMIIAPEDFAEALQPLMVHKDRTGISNRLFTLEYIRETYSGSSYVDDPERIKHAIYDEYVNNFDPYYGYGIRYVMLVGDANVFPIRYIIGDLVDGRDHAKVWEPSDLYYADILDGSGNFHSWDRDGNGWFGELYRHGINWDEIDSYPDVYAMRVPAENVEEVRNYVAKVIRYELRAANGGWFDHMTFSVIPDPDWAPRLLQSLLPLTCKANTPVLPLPVITAVIYPLARFPAA
jgi:hypothetical protein